MNALRQIAAFGKCALVDATGMKQAQRRLLPTLAKPLSIGSLIEHIITSADVYFCALERRRMYMPLHRVSQNVRVITSDVYAVASKMYQPLPPYGAGSMKPVWPNVWLVFYIMPIMRSIKCG